MKSIFLNLIIILINLISFSSSQLNGKCGYPGKPYNAKLEPDNKQQYSEGEEVTYQCTNFWSHLQMRKCEKGRWTGKQPRCGDFIDNVLMKDVKVEDISNPDKPILKFEYMDMIITNTNWSYPNAFTSNRFKKARLRIFDTKRYKWSFNFTVPTVKLFVRINFNFINYTFMTPEQKQNFTFFISLFVSPERKCVLEEQTDDKWREHGRKTDSTFTCDSISTDAYNRDIKNPGNYMVMETQASHPLQHDLIAVFFGKAYGTPEEPICGEPEVSVGHLSRFNQQYKDYIIDCKSEKTWLYVSKQNDIIPETTIHGFKCKGDMIWDGSYPECIPLKPCPLDRLLIGPNSNRTVINSFDGLYFFNESTYYANEGTHVQYGCVNPSVDIMVGKEMRVCFKNGSWSGAEPYCYDPNEKEKFPLLLVILVLLGSLTFVIILTVTLFYVYTKRIKNRITKQIANHTRPESGGFDGYDDIGIPSDLGKEIYDTYDVVEEVDPRYAPNTGYSEPYYKAGQDYVQIHNQTGDDYWRIPSSEPTYLEMTCNPKPLPFPRRSLKKDEKHNS